MEHVVGRAAFSGDVGEAYAVVFCPGGEAGFVAVPDAAACFVDGMQIFELGEEEGGRQVGHDVAGAEVDPGVFVDLPAEEAGAVGALFPEYFGAGVELEIVDEERAAFAAGVVLGFVEAQGGMAPRVPRGRPL
jgi:hypothetical protein